MKAKTRFPLRPVSRQWPQTTERALSRAGANRAQLERALRQIPVASRDDLRFLIENMPDRDARSLSAAFLLRHVALSRQGLARAPWKTRIPRALYLNDVLPYASLTETRDASRAYLQDKAQALVMGCKTPSEAAMRLNEKLFPLVKVRYSTARQRADQSALESSGSGLASCSGLSILLVDACRSVGVPARVVGTPMWANGRGNHTWVEIWDGKWHFLGAAEPDAQGLDHGWFVGDAAQARAGIPQNAIYASSFQRTGLAFPLVWAPEVRWVSAVNVTARYARPVAPATNKTRVLLKVVDGAGKRVAAPVVVMDLATQTEIFRGTSRGESADTNDFLSVELPRGAHYSAKIGAGGATQTFEVKEDAEQLILLTNAPAEATLENALSRYFLSSPQEQANFKFAPEFEKRLLDDENGVRRLAWQTYRAAPIHADAKADFEAHQVRFLQYLSPYLIKTVGTQPPGGWGLVIAMHGGGGTAKEVNDSQWQGMFKHYKDHPEAGGYRYLALRAPNDTWNGFYDDYVYPLVENLIRQQTIWGDVDPSKVFILGYSHGGYGAYAIGLKMPDRFAAIHASAGAATDGETAAQNLRNTPFTAMVGEKDLAYDRLSRNQRFDAEIRALRGERTDIYPVRVDVMAGFEHSNLKDGDTLAEMLPHTRSAAPRELSWRLTDTVIRDFFWVGCDNPAKEREISASCRDNRVQITTKGAPKVRVYLDSRLIDFSKPVEFDIDGQKSQRSLKPSLRVLCETLARRGDPDLAFTAQIELP